MVASRKRTIKRRNKKNKNNKNRQESLSLSFVRIAFQRLVKKLSQIPAGVCHQQIPVSVFLFPILAKGYSRGN